MYTEQGSPHDRNFGKSPLHQKKRQWLLFDNNSKKNCFYPPSPIAATPWRTLLNFSEVKMFIVHSRILHCEGVRGVSPSNPIFFPSPPPEILQKNNRTKTITLFPRTINTLLLSRTIAYFSPPVENPA